MSAYSPSTPLDKRHRNFSMLVNANGRLASQHLRKRYDTDTHDTLAYVCRPRTFKPYYTSENVITPVNATASTR